MVATERVRRGHIRSADLPTHRGASVDLPARLDGPGALDRWHDRVHDPAALIVLDLFCGAGGMSEGFEAEGFVVAAGIDADAAACATYAANATGKTLCHDLACVHTPDQAQALVAGLGIPRVDVIVGGPPCQGFSVVGRARIRSLPREEQRREILGRNELYRNFFRFVEALRPLMFVIENVQAMRTWEDGLLFQAMLDTARALGYDTFEDVLNAADYGVPQSRRRQFIVGSRIGRVFRFPASRGLPAVSLDEAIGDLPVVQAPSLVETLPYNPRRIGPYQQLMRSRVRAGDAGVVHDHVVRPVRDDDREVFRLMEPGDRYLDIDPRYRRYDDRSFEDRYFKLRPDIPCITITAHMAKDGYRYIHWDRDQCRTLSVREAARAQSFDDAFRFAGHRSNRYRQIGNAVPPLLARELAVRVRRAIEGGHDVVEDREWQLALPWPDRLLPRQGQERRSDGE